MRRFWSIKWTSEVDIENYKRQMAIWQQKSGMSVNKRCAFERETKAVLGREKHRKHVKRMNLQS